MAVPQLGLLSYAQLRGAGLNNDAIRHRVAKGRLAVVLPGVYEICGTPHSWDRDLMAVHLWAGDESAAAGRAAARKWGFAGFENAPIEISTTQRKRFTGRVSSGRVIVHHVDVHLVAEIVAVAGMPVTSARRTVLDLAAMRHRLAESCLDHSLRRQLTNVGQLWLLLEQEWMRGRRGVAILRDMLVPRTEGRAPTESELEIMARRIIDDHGLPEPIHQQPVTLSDGPKRIDLAYPSAMLAIELDSYAWHMNRAAFEADRRRDNELRALGWTVFRFTYGMLRWDEDHVATLIRDHLAGSSAYSADL
jgi:hypothetical protein